ncbi:MAG: AI-2E family transporter [Lachnospiraceae bacterium]|nr:AI-2E family transporter [Lachnospiraceae bacterium]
MKNFKEDMNPKYTLIALYVIATCMAIVILVRLLDHIDIVFNALNTVVKWAGLVMQPIIGGLIIAYLLDPLVDFFEHQIEKVPYIKKRGRDGRPIAVALTVAMAFLIVILLFSLIISTVTRQLTLASLTQMTDIMNQYGKTLNSFYSSLQKELTEMNIATPGLREALDELVSAIGKAMKAQVGGVGRAISNIGSIFTSAIFIIIFAIYFMLDGKGLARYWNNVLIALSNEKFDTTFHNFLKRADRIFSGYIRGQLIDALIMAMMISISLSIIGVKFSIIIGILTGIGNLIPYVGGIVAYGSTILVCVINGDFTKLLISLVILFIVQTVDGNVINPKLLSSNIKIHPLLVIASLIVGSSVGGFFGMIFAVPVGALIKELFDEIIDRISKRRNKLSE